MSCSVRLHLRTDDKTSCHVTSVRNRVSKAHIIRCRNSFYIFWARQGFESLTLRLTVLHANHWTITNPHRWSITILKKSLDLENCLQFCMWHMALFCTWVYKFLAADTGLVFTQTSLKGKRITHKGLQDTTSVHQLSEINSMPHRWNSKTLNGGGGVRWNRNVTYSVHINRFVEGQFRISWQNCFNNNE